jgi:hypothetical protein
MAQIEEFLKIIHPPIATIGAYLVLAYALSQARRVHNDTVSNIEQFGDDSETKRLVAQKSIFNFYLILVSIIVVVAQVLNVFGKELVVALLVALFTGLGVNLVQDIKTK